MRIAFYAPLKPLGHPHPSGDLVIGTGLYQFLEGRGHVLERVSRFRSRWIYWNLGAGLSLFGPRSKRPNVVADWALISG
jgi:hypothetical protein